MAIIIKELPQTQSVHFLYLGCIHQDGGIKVDVIHKIKEGWLTQRSASGVLCNRRVRVKLKRNL